VLFLSLLKDPSLSAQLSQTDDIQIKLFVSKALMLKADQRGYSEINALIDRHHTDP